MLPFKLHKIYYYHVQHPTTFHDIELTSVTRSVILFVAVIIYFTLPPLFYANFNYVLPPPPPPPPLPLQLIHRGNLKLCVVSLASSWFSQAGFRLSVINEHLRN